MPSIAQIVVAEMGTLFPCMVAKVHNRRSEYREKDGAEPLAVAALPVVLNEPPENPVLLAIGAFLLVKEGHDGLPVGKRGEVAAIGLQPPVELYEFFGDQLLADAGKGKAHASVAAWASRARKQV